MEALNKPKKKASTTKTTCKNRVRCVGLKKDGKLRKGYYFQKGTGNVIKRKTNIKKKAPATRSSKKNSGIFGLGILGIL